MEAVRIGAADVGGELQLVQISRHPGEGRHADMTSDTGAPASFDPWPASSVHLEWGPAGGALAASRGDVVIIVDVLSFSTTLTVAVERDFTCLVYNATEIAGMGGLAVAAARLGARPVSKRRRVPAGEISLSPASLLTAERGQRVLFSSLNGAASVSAAAAAPALLVGSLRNASACSAAAAALRDQGVSSRISVIACGERWDSVQQGVDGLRPSVEDWFGAGLICSWLDGAGLELSVEAQVAASSLVSPDLLAECISARELRAAGFSDDVGLALEVDVSQHVPVRLETEASRRAFAADLAARTGR